MSGHRFAFTFAVFTLLVLLTATSAGPAPSDRGKEDAFAKEPGTEIEVRYIDNSNMKLRILDEKLELVTKHGVLKIAVADIRRIEFATRVPPDVVEKIAAAVEKLGHPDSQLRDRATVELRGYRDRAYQPVLAASKGSDAEVVRRAESVVQFIKHTVPTSELQPREFDVIHTDDSRISGKLTLPSFRVKTFQFGEQVLRLADLRSVGAGVNAPVVAFGPPAPPNMLQYQGQFGKEFTFTVTGGGPNAAWVIPQNAPIPLNGGGVVMGGNVWGTDIYTLDSTFSMAAVHAGQVQPGQQATVRVRIIPPPPQFTGSNRNGVQSMNYANFPAGAYEFIPK